MKKLVSVVMVLCMTLALTACGKEQSASYRMETEQGGIAMTDTMALDSLSLFWFIVMCYYKLSL